MSAQLAATNTTNNPFNPDGGQIVNQPSGTVQAEQSRAIAETQASMAIAKRFPRNQMEAMDRILNSCQRSSLAEKATYVYARGGSNITGPSIRLAECVAQNWGNIQYGIRELDQRLGVSEVEAFAWDIETNTRQVKVFQVRHERHKKGGVVSKLTDPRDIYEMVANQGARRLRACILGVIPGDVIEAAVSECEKTLKTTADTSPEVLKRMVEHFGKYGVTKAMIEKRIQRKMDAITPAQLVGLKQIYNSMEEGMSSVGDWFEPEDSAAADSSKTDSIKEKLKGNKPSGDKASQTTLPDPPPAA